MHHLYYLKYAICTSGHHMLPNPLPRQVESIPMDKKYFKDLPLLTYLAYLLPKEHLGSIKMLSPATEYYISSLITLNQNINSYLCSQLVFQSTRLQSFIMINIFECIYTLFLLTSFYDVESV